MSSTRVITHRGLDSSLPNFPMESSIEAFRNQLERGYGLEFDVRRTKDNQLVVIHDSNLKRASGGSDHRDISEATLAEIVMTDFKGSHLASFGQVLSEIAHQQHAGALSAIHLKHDSQDESILDLILSGLADVHLDPNKLIMFDVKPESARYLKQKDPSLHLAASVAHSYDIERYNSAVGGTLLSIDEVLAHRDLFDWVWLDEWDRVDRGGARKVFYTKEVIEVLHNADISVALVTPELHASSPSLLGEEAHEDAKDLETLHLRLKEIISYGPDAVCTDYPDYVKSLLI